MSTNEITDSKQLNNIINSFKKAYPTEAFLAENDTVKFIFELADLLKLYSEKDYSTILPKIASCIEPDVANGKLNKKSIEKIKLCLKK